VNELAGVGLSYEELTELIEEADKHGDSVVRKQDFISVMKRTNLFK
jgi:Ca2+-binding EF-hand superfamily protein